jgi:PAS domain S-box-containing protein
MERSSTDKEKEAEKLQQRVRELERQLADTRSALEILKPRVFRHEDQVQNNEHLSRALFDAPYPIMIRRDDGRVLMINAAWTQITGYALEDIPTLQEWTNKAYGEQALQREAFIIRKGFAQTGIKQWGEYEVQTRSGEKRLWSFSTAPLGFDDQGRELVMVMVVDVTEHRQAENALEESERQQKEMERLLELDRARLSTILENLPVGVWIMDEEGQIIGKNRQADQIWAGDAPLLDGIEEYQQYESWDARSGKRLEPNEYPVAQALSTGQPIGPVELNIRRFDDSQGTVLVSAAPINDSLGTLTGVVAINVDITTRKQFEQALEDSEERFSKAFRKAPFAMNITRWEDGIILDVNDAWLTLLGWTRDEVLGKSTAEFPFYARPEDRAAVRERIMHDDSLDDMELLLVRKDGEQRSATVATTIIEVNGERCILGVLHDITDRKLAEAALRESEQHYRSLFETMQEGLVAAEVITDDSGSPIDYRYLDVNPAIERQYNIPREQFIGRTYTEVLPEWDQEWIEILGRVALTGQPANVEKFGIASGRWFEAHAYSPRAGQFINILTDITERKLAEAALKESQQRFSIMFEKAPFAAALSKLPEGLIVNINEEFERMFGYTRQEATGKTSLQLGINPNEVERTSILAQLQSRGSARNVETSLCTKSGERRVFLLNIDRVRVGEDQYALQTAQDITVSKKAEESLRESEERFHSLADSMPQLVWTAMPDGTVDYYNRRHQEYRDIKQVEGKSWEWAPVLHPDDVAATMDAWQYALATGTTYQIEHRVRMADESYRWHLSRGIPMRNESGKVVRWFGTATDIHESKLAEEKLKDYAARLERSNRELEQFAFMASHDLQEPLRKIQVFGDLLLDRATSLEDREREYLERMRNAAGRMREMVDGLLQLSRINTQSKPFTDVNLSQVTHKALADLAERIRNSGGHVTVDTLPMVKGDALQLRQVMHNLIGNALKYHQPGIAPRMNIRAAQSAETVQIFVEDNGIGFEQEHAERIFQPFQRLVGRSQYEGSGMGLAICRKIIDRHGGEITAQSTPGMGTTFVITLPTYTQPHAEKDPYEH